MENRSCLPCPAGTYQPDEGSTACLKCPYRLSITEPGAFRESHCIDICKFVSFFTYVSFCLSIKEPGAFRESQCIDRCKFENFVSGVWYLSVSVAQNGLETKHLFDLLSFLWYGH